MKKWIALAFLGLVLAAPARAMVFTGSLNGTNEIPPNASPGTGFVTVTMDLDLHTLRIECQLPGIARCAVTAAHIHCCTSDATPNVSPATQTPSFVNFPLGVMAGSYDMTFDTSQASTWNAVVRHRQRRHDRGRRDRVLQRNDGRQARTSTSTARRSPAGEIRANLAPIPEPSTYALLLAGLAVVGGVATRRRR